MSKSRGDEWYTPRWLVNALGPFDLDPAAPARSHWTATRCYTKADDGLRLPWNGRVFLNPPYSEPQPWVERLIEHGNAIALFFVRTDTKWMQQTLGVADAAFLLRGRIPFVDIEERKSGTPAAASILLAFGENNVKAIREAQKLGAIDGQLLFTLKYLERFVPTPRENDTGADLGFNKLAAD